MRTLIETGADTQNAENLATAFETAAVTTHHDLEHYEDLQAYCALQGVECPTKQELTATRNVLTAFSLWLLSGASLTITRDQSRDTAGAPFDLMSAMVLIKGLRPEVLADLLGQRTPGGT